VDKLRLKKKLGMFEKRTAEEVFQALQDYFSF